MNAINQSNTFMEEPSAHERLRSDVGNVLEDGKSSNQSLNQLAGRFRALLFGESDTGPVPTDDAWQYMKSTLWECAYSAYDQTSLQLILSDYDALTVGTMTNAIIEVRKNLGILSPLIIRATYVPLYEELPDETS